MSQFQPQVKGSIAVGSRVGAVASVTALPVGADGTVLTADSAQPSGLKYAAVSGFQGPQGFQGPEGNQGFQGPEGTQGFQGPQGNQGISGFQGNQGQQGSQGSGIASVGSPSITSVEAISVTGPASYVAGGFTATFTNLATVHRAVICLVSGTTYIFIITAKATNQVTIRCFRALKAHAHSLSMTAHSHAFVSGAATGAGNALDQGGGTIGNANGGDTTPAGSATGVQNTTSTGTVGSTSSDPLEEVAAGVNLSGETLELLGFGV